MGKYDPLAKFLKLQPSAQLPMTFKEVEAVLGTSLPPSAHQYPAWWSNDITSHVQAKAWLNAGYETQQVDMEAKTLVFKCVHPASPKLELAESQHGFRHETSAETPKRHPLIGALKGWLIIEPGYDLTEPAMPEWARLVDEKYGPEKR
jgi:hypothetical protein